VTRFAFVILLAAASGHTDTMPPQAMPASPLVERWEASCPCGVIPCACWPPNCGCEWKATHTRMGYDEARRQAVSRKKRLVVFVGQQLRDLPGCISVSAETFAGLPWPHGIVVGVPDGYRLARYNLDRWATDAQILAAGGVPPTVRTVGAGPVSQ
jgi:hypothetical protein